MSAKRTLKTFGALVVINAKFTSGLPKPLVLIFFTSALPAFLLFSAFAIWPLSGEASIGEPLADDALDGAVGRSMSSTPSRTRLL